MSATLLLTKSSVISGAVKARFPNWVPPMLLHSSRQPFNRPGWIYEPKLDGMRCLAFIRDGHCRIFSRHGRNVTATFPALVRELSLQQGDMILDGEIVAHGPTGKPSLQLLAQRWMLNDSNKVSMADRTNPVSFFAFDILYNEGFSLTNVRLTERKRILQEFLSETHRVKRIEHFTDGVLLYKICFEGGYEGIVCKREGSVYRPGQRSTDWIKVKYAASDRPLNVGYTDYEEYLFDYYEFDDPTLCVRTRLPRL